MLSSVCVCQVDDSGKVSRLRKQCPQCGPGIFMATHFDRVYCGKCTTTYLVSSRRGQTVLWRVGWGRVGCVSQYVATRYSGVLKGGGCAVISGLRDEEGL